MFPSVSYQVDKCSSQIAGNCMAWDCPEKDCPVPVEVPVVVQPEDGLVLLQ